MIISDQVAEIRFPEFSCSLKEYDFGDLYEFKSTNSFPRDLLNYQGGDVKNIHYGDIHKNFASLFDINNETVPYINMDVDLTRIKKEQFISNGDLVIADASEDYKDIGKAIEVISIAGEKIVAGLHTFLARRTTDLNYIGYVTYLLQTWFVRKQIMRIAQGTKVLSLSTSRVSKLKLLLPEIEEQQKIADFLSSVDKKIALLKEKHDLLTLYKKGVMQKLFAQEIRFKDEAGNHFHDWKEERFSNILDLQLNALKMKDESEYELITVRRRNGGVDSRGIYKGKDVLVKNQFELKANQFVISKRQIVHGACGLVPEELAGAIVSNEYNVFEAVPEKLDITYFNIMATTLPMRRAFFINSDGVHIEKLLFKTQSWLKTKLDFPCVDEQKKIVKFIESLDKKLNLVSEQIEHTQTFKKGLLQQMFV